MHNKKLYRSNDSRREQNTGEWQMHRGDRRVCLRYGSKRISETGGNVRAAPSFPKLRLLKRWLGKLGEFPTLGPSLPTLTHSKQRTTRCHDAPVTLKCWTEPRWKWCEHYYTINIMIFPYLNKPHRNPPAYSCFKTWTTTQPLKMKVFFDTLTRLRHTYHFRFHQKAFMVKTRKGNAERAPHDIIRFVFE